MHFIGSIPYSFNLFSKFCLTFSNKWFIINSSNKNNPMTVSLCINVLNF
jgi:hypothetical protein